MPKLIKSRSKKWLQGALALLLVIGVITALEATNTTHLFHTEKAHSGTIPTLDTKPTKQVAASAPANTTTPTGDASSTNGASSPAQGSPKDTTSGSTDSTTALTAPFGSFVSNHKPSLSGSSSPSQELSSCSTSAGAVCHIEFTQGDVIKKLEPRTTDSSGSVSWTWDVKQAGLTEGSWHITAIATLNGQTKSTQDNLTLEVQP